MNNPYQKPNCESQYVLHEIMSLGYSEKWPLAKLYFKILKNKKSGSTLTLFHSPHPHVGFWQSGHVV